MTRKSLWLVYALVVLALVLSACARGTPTPTPTPQPVEQPQQPTPTKAQPMEEPTPTPVAEFKCEDPLGCVEIAPGDPIRIAYMLVVSGPNESLGVDSRRGIEIAIDDVGGELLGRPIELVGEDSLCSPEGGQAAAQKIAADKSIVGVIGTNCSSAAKNAAPIISEAGMVMISPSNTAPYLTDPATRSPGYFRTAHNDKVQGRVAAEFAYNVLGARKAATIHDGSVYAEQLANVFAEVFKELGGEVVAQEAVNVGDTDMRPVLTTIAAAGPDIIYYPIFIAEGALITRQAKEVAGLEDVILMGADGMFSPDFIEAAGEAAVGAYLTSPDFTAFAGGYQEFLRKHEEKYGEKPLSAFHAHAYDATMILFEAIKKVAVTGPDGTLYIPRQALRDAIASTKNFQGLTGNLTCDPNGDCADPKIAVYQITAAGEWNPDDPNKSPVKIYPK